MKCQNLFAVKNKKIMLFAEYFMQHAKHKLFTETQQFRRCLHDWIYFSVSTT